MTTPRYEEIRARFEERGQEHVLAGWGTLPTDRREELLAQCAAVDLDWVEERWREYRNRRTALPAPGGLEPAPVVELPGTEAGGTRRRELLRAGEDLLRRGKVAAFLVAGGQGTRLGFDGPKGCFPVGPISGRTLFAWHAERILARGRRHGVAIPWYVMTSHENDTDTRLFFERNNHFGLDGRDIFFFRQGMVPSLDFQGKLMLSSPSTLAMNPDGHGGSLPGLLHSGALRDMRERGVEVVGYFQVDNPLVDPCDPLFLGLHREAGAEMSSKVVEKNSPDERMGVACLHAGESRIVEYTDLDDESKNAVDENGRLRFWAGSIAMHLIDAAFIERVAREAGLPWHPSVKTVPRFASGRLVRPEQENAVKFETFVFDALPHAGNTVVMKVSREHEFAPVKNARGADSAETCRQALSRHFRAWLAEAGVAVPEREGDGPVAEISPLYSLDATELARKIKPGGFALERALLMG